MAIRVLFATPEVDDFVRVGGLGAVSAALPRALNNLCDVRLVIPAYRSVLSQAAGWQRVGAAPALSALPGCTFLFTKTADGLPVYAVDCPALFDRPGNPYGDEQGVDWHDNDIRFGRFCSAAALLAAGQIDPNWRADIVHANDWPSALIPAYLAWSGASTS